MFRVDSDNIVIGCAVAIVLMLFCMCGYMILQNRELLDEYVDVRTERLERIEDAVEGEYVWYKDGRVLSQEEVSLIVARDESFGIRINDETKEVTVIEYVPRMRSRSISLFPMIVP